MIPSDVLITNTMFTEYCEKIKENHWREIYVKKGTCNHMTDDLVISEYPNLEKLVFEGSPNVDTIANLNSLTISKNPKLQSIELTDGNNKHGVLFNVKTVVISGNKQRIVIIKNCL